MTGHSTRATTGRRAGALAHASGAPAAEGLERVRYEGYGPDGAAVLVECLTIDRARAAAAVRRTFLENGGQLGAAGAVGYLFNTVALMTYPPGTDEESLQHAALEAGAEDVVANADGSCEVLADPLELASVRARLTQQGFAPASAEVTQRAAVSLTLSGERAQAMLALLDALGRLEEVHAVYANVQICTEVPARP